MNEEALKDAHSLFVNTGYNGDINEFQLLLSENAEAFADSYGLFTQSGYNGSEDDYKKLLGLKKKDTSELQEAVSPGGIQDTPSTSEDGQSSLVQKTQDSLERRFVSFADEEEESLRPFYEAEGINYDDFLYANKVQEKVKEEQSKTKSGRAKSRIADQSQIDEANRYLASIDDNVLQAQSKIERKKLQDIIDSSKSTLEYEQKIASSGLDFRMLPMEQLKINGQAVFGKELESKLYDQDFIEAYQKGDVTIDIDTSSGIEYFKEMEMLAKRQLESGGQWGDVAESLWAGGLDLLAAGPLEIIEGANALLVDVVEGVVIKPVSEAFGGEEIEYGSRFKHYMKEGGYYSTKIKEYTDDVREDIRAYEQQGITKSLIAGNYSDAFFQGSNALAESTPLIVGLYASTPLLAASFGSKAASAITLTGVGASAAGVKSLDLKKMRRDGEISISDGQLIANMILTGVAEGLFERYTLGLINSARKIVKTTNTPAKELADSYIKGLGKSFGVESTSEGLTEASNIFTDAITGVGTPESLGDFLSQVADAQLIGGVMGVGMHSVPYVFNALTDVSSLRDNISAVFTLEDGTTTEMKFTEARNFVKDKEISQGIRDGRIKMDASITEKGRQILEEIVYGYYAPDNVEARAVMFEKEKAVKDLVDRIEEKSKPREDEDGKTIKGTPPTPEDVTSIADAVSEMEAEGKKNKYNVSKSTEAIRERVGKFFKDNGIEVVDAVNDQDTSMSNVTETVESNSIDSVEEYNSIKQQLKDGKRKPTVVKSQNQSGIKIKGEDVQKSDITQGKFKSVSAARNAMKEFEAKQKANKNVKPTTEQIAKDNNKAFVKAKKDALDSVPKEVIDSGDYHIISPDRAGLTKAELQSRMENTRADLEASGATVYTITEVVDGKPKQSLLVTNTTNAVALGTARGLQVQSVFSGKDGILNTDGSIVPLDNSNLSGPEARRAGDISIVNVNGRKTSIHRGVDKSKTVFGKSFDANNVHRLDESDPNYDKELLDGVPSDRKRALGFALKFLNSIDGLRVMVVRNSDNMYKQLKSLGYSDMKAKRGAYSNSLYRGEDGTIYINLERVKGNTLFHEIAHPLVDFMKRVAPKTYAKIEEEVSKGKVKRRYTEDGKRMKGTYLEWAFLNYTEPSEKAVYFNRETQKFDIDRFKKENPDRFKYFVEEAFAEMIGDAAYGHFLNKQSRLGKLRELIREILSKIGVSYFEQPEKISLDDLRLEDGLFKSGVLSNVSRALVNERTITVGGIDFEVSESEYGTRGQLSELESIEIAKEVTDKVIQGKSVDTYKSTKTSKEKGGKYVSFSGEINVDNVKKESMTSYVSEASKFFLYNTTPTSPYDQLRSNMEGASKKEIKTVLDHNKAKIKSKINSLEKSIKKSSDKSNIESLKSDLKILKSAEKSKTLNDQLDLILSVSSFALKNSLYRNTFFKLGDSGLKINKDSDLEAYSDSIIELSKSTIKSNLKVVYDSVSKNVRDISKLWYDGANLIAQDMASSYGVSLEQASAIIATQSPQMPWFDNLHLADVIMDVLHNRKEEVFSQEMFDYYVEKAEGYASQKKYIPELKKSIGKKLSELNQYDKAIFIRTYFDLYLDRKAPIRIPTGTTVEFNQTSNSSFGGYNTIAKAVSVFEDGSMENISNNIGNANKVRNFYLNIANPTDKRAVTIDTHAMAIALFKPLASNDNEVNFGPASFAVYADAYRELASEIGIEARSLQSITWEAARAIFPAKKKADPKYKEEINSFWSKYNEGSLPLFEVQNYIFRIGDNPNLTEWSNYINNLKDEKNRGNVSGRISRLGGVDPSIQSRDNTIPDERVSDTREKDTLSSRRPDADVSDGIRAQAPNVEEVVWEESKIGKGDRAITNRNDAVQKGANDYFARDIEYEEYLKIVKDNSLIKPITKFMEPASLSNVEFAIGKKSISKKTGESMIDVPIEEGREVGVRLDINAYVDKNTWVVTVHDSKVKRDGSLDVSGSPISYTNVARIKNVTFASNPGAALNIARGRSKATIARMMGNWSPLEGDTPEARAENAKSIVVEVMNDPSWVQVGMNPFRHSYFYDRLDGMPVVKADEVVQIGGLVYAKNAEKTSPLDERFRDPKSGLRFQISGEIETGSPFTFTYNKNPEQAPDMGSMFGQDVEPTGDYVTRNEGFTPEGFESGLVTVKNPLVIDITDETQVSYKNDLSDSYDGKTGQELSDAIKEDGFDSIITLREDGSTGEIVLLDDQRSARFQVENTDGQTNVYRTGLAAIAWDIGMNVIMADYAAGKYITGSGVFRLIDKSKRRANKEDRGYDIRLSTLLGKPFGTHSNEEIKEIMVRSKGNLNLELNRVSEASKRLEKAIKGSDLTSEEVNELLHDKSKIDKVEDKNLKRALVEVRSHIDRLSRTLIDEGLINGQTQFTVDANMGVYISRSYKQFERKNWKQTDTDIEKRAKEFLYNEAKKEYPNYTEAKLRDKAKTALDNLMDEKDFAYYMTDGANLAGLSRINTIFKQRKLVPKEIREFWGENDNPVYNYSQTASKIARTIAAERMYKELLEVGDGKFVSDEQTSEFFNEISGERFGSLNGKFVDNEMFAVMNQVNRQINSDGFNKLYNLYMKLVLFNKKMKTIYNPGTHVKNVIGNTAFAMMNGHINFDVLEMYGYAKETYRSLGTASDSDARALYEKLISLGVVNSSASLQELRNIAEDISKNEFDLESFLEKSKFVKFIVDGGKWVDKKVTNAYQMEDDMWKIFGFLSERGRYLDAGLDLKTAEELSAKNIRNLYPNYDQIPRVIRMLGRSPLVGSFVAFQAEAVRNAKNAIKLGFEEIGSDNPKIRNIGASRLAGTLATTTLVGGLQLYTAQFLAQSLGFLGEDEEESEARKIRFLLPKWDAVGNLFVFDRGTLDSMQYEKQGSGDVYFDYINFSSISGVGYIKDVFRLAFTDIETTAGRESATRVLEKIYEPFLSQEMTAIAVKEALDNSKEKIYKSTDEWYDKLFKMIKHVGNNVQPGATRAGTRIYEAEFDESTDLVTEYEILALLGIRISRVNVNKNLSIKGYFINQDMIRLVGRDGMKSEDAVRESYRTNERFDEELNKMADVIAAAVEQGISGEDAENILRYGRDSKKRSGISEYVIQEAYQRWLERYIFDSKNVE